jgi:hypothetical protein
MSKGSIISATTNKAIATHDICSNPSQHGCTPHFFDDVAQYAVGSGFFVLKVRDALLITTRVKSRGEVERRGCSRGAQIQHRIPNREVSLHRGLQSGRWSRRRRCFTIAAVCIKRQSASRSVWRTSHYVEVAIHCWNRIDVSDPASR